MISDVFRRNTRLCVSNRPQLRKSLRGAFSAEQSLNLAWLGQGMPKSPFRYFKTSPEIIQLAVMMYVRFPLSLRNVEDLLHERGIDVCHESIRLWVDRFGPMFAGKIRVRRASFMRQIPQWRWHLDEVFVKINGVQHYL